MALNYFDGDINCIKCSKIFWSFDITKYMFCPDCVFQFKVDNLELEDGSQVKKRKNSNA